MQKKQIFVHGGNEGYLLVRQEEYPRPNSSLDASTITTRVPVGQVFANQALRRIVDLNAADICSSDYRGTLYSNAATIAEFPNKNSRRKSWRIQSISDRIPEPASSIPWKQHNALPDGTQPDLALIVDFPKDRAGLNSLEPGSQLLSLTKETIRVELADNPADKQELRDIDRALRGFELSVPVTSEEAKKLIGYRDQLLSWQRSYTQVDWDRINASPQQPTRTRLGGHKTTTPHTFVTVSDALPSAQDYKDPNTFWGWSKNRSAYCDGVAIVVSASMLRRQGAIISRHLSWEQSVIDVIHEFSSFAPMANLDTYGHVFVRFGVTGVLHRYRNKKNVVEVELYFDPDKPQGQFRDPEEEGRIFGKNVMLAASMINQLISKHAEKNAKSRGKAIRIGVGKAIRMMQATYTAGFPRAQMTYPNTESAAENFIPAYMDEAVAVGEAKNEQRIIGTLPVQVPPSEDWQILRNSLGLGDDFVRLNVALAIAKFGIENVLNTERFSEEVQDTLMRGSMRHGEGDTSDLVTLPEGRLPLRPHPTGGERLSAPQNHDPRPIFVPLIRFKKLLALERREIESLRAAKNLITIYLQDRNQKKPISVAIFGPPGTGKSFAVEQIAEDLNIAWLKYNVSQFKSEDELAGMFEVVMEANVKGQVPLVFIDEFDCDDLRWLKFFLEPMQDGTYLGTKQPLELGRAIFVFAGGTASEFEEFNRVITADNRWGEAELSEFKRRKGPDFVSRLRGHIDIAPIDADEYENKRVVRRSIILRGLIEKYKFLKENVNHIHVSQVSDDVLYALLTIDRYRHGVRSMEAILQMTSPHFGRLTASALPSRAQLDMHVNAEEFHRRVLRNRALRLHTT